MLSTASQCMPRARSLRTRHAAVASALGLGCAQGIRQRQQTRGFRWGLWSNIDDDFSREVRRRQRMLKHKYSEQLNRRLSWEKHPFCDESRHALKRIMKSYWLSSYPVGRFCDDADPTKHACTDSKHGARPGQNIEDVERGAMNHLMFGEHEEPTSHHPFPHRNLKRQRAEQDLNHASESSYGQPIELGDCFIDPITNRKVAKQPTSSSLKNSEDIPVKTFRDYRSQFTSPDVIFEQAGSSSQPARPCLQSSEYIQSHGSRDSKHDQTNTINSGESGSPVSPKANDAASFVGEVAGSRDSLRDRSSQNSALDGHLISSAEGLARNHRDLFQRKTAVEEAHGEFDDLHPPQDRNGFEPYKSVLADEFASRVEDVRPPVDDQNYSAMCESNFMRDAELIYDSIDQLDGSVQCQGKPLDLKEDFVKPEFSRQYRSAIHPVQPGDFLESTVEDLRAKYGAAELKQYTAVRHGAPEETSGLTSDDEKAHGGSSVGIELDGRRFPVEELSYSETHHDLLDSTHQELDTCAVAQSKQCQKKPNAHTEYAIPQHIELEEGPDEFMASREALERLGSVKQGHGRKPTSSPCIMFEEPQDKLPVGSEAVETPDPSRPDFEKLASVKQGQGKQSNYREMLESLMSEHEQQSDAHDDEAVLSVKLAKAKNQNVDVPKPKLTGNYIRDFPEEFEKSWTQTLSSIPAEAETTCETEALADSETMDGGLEGAFGRPSPSRIQPALDRHRSAKPVIEQDGQDKKESEGFKTLHHDEIGDQSKQSDIVSDAKNEVIPVAAGEEIGTIAVESQLKSDTAEESCEAFEKTSLTSENEPVLYKILAYDPTMQKINMAETTSIVPDFASALSPADALLRLSHPTKFFPHFASLEAEGFEIASGSGDVLVFRKVRRPKPEQASEGPMETGTEAIEHPPTIESPVNPIDMTGRPRVVSPASANFASPTGYVKYDNLPKTETDKLPPPPPARVAYNIKLRREEPVYSGPKHRLHGDQRQRRSLGHRLLIGGVWVAGISYGLGVVSEYFSTGGMDGLGPQGL